MNDYYSFLICARKNKTELYYCGMPIGTITDGKFEIHHFLGADKVKRPLTIQDLPHPCPFENMEELKQELKRIIDHL